MTVASSSKFNNGSRMVGGRADCGGRGGRCGVMTVHSFDNKRKSSASAEMKPMDARMKARDWRRKREQQVSPREPPRRYQSGEEGLCQLLISRRFDDASIFHPFFCAPQSCTFASDNTIYAHFSVRNHVTSQRHRRLVHSFFVHLAMAYATDRE